MSSLDTSNGCGTNKSWREIVRYFFEIVKRENNISHRRGK